MTRIDFGVHRNPELGVQFGKRLIKRKDRRIAHDSALHRDAQTPSAGKPSQAGLYVFHSIIDTEGGGRSLAPRWQGEWRTSCGRSLCVDHRRSDAIPLRGQEFRSAQPSTHSTKALDSHAEVFHDEVVFDSVPRSLAAKAGLLDPAKWRNRGRNHAGIDAHHAVLRAFAHPPDAT